MKNVLFAVLLMLVLVVPAGFVGAGEQKETETTEPVFIETDNPDISLVSVSDDTELSRINEKFELPDFSGYQLGVRDDEVEFENVHYEEQNILANGFSRGYDLAIEDPTRAGSDDEDNNDLWNGSLLSDSDSVTGELYWPANDPQGSLGDYIDWYKMDLRGVNPTVPGSLKNVTFSMDSFESEEETLYELTYSDTEYTTDFLDFMEIFIFYDAPYWGGSEMGGRMFWYDDGDPTDGWTYDGVDNITTNFRTPQNSRGTEDTNGGTNGLTEDGWFYIALRFNYYVTPDAYDRTDFYIDYEFSVSTATESNYFPGISTNEGAPNDFWNATSTPPTQVARSHSAMNHFDWYKFQGMDQTKIWNQTVYVNTSRWSMMNPMVGGQSNDNWLWVYFMWWGPGDDGIYDTIDDEYDYDYKCLYAYVSYINVETGETLPFFVWRGDTSNIQLTNINNRTDATAGHPALDGEPRQLFVGIWTEPITTVTTTTGTFQSYSSFQGYNQYTIEWNVHEVPPNNAPEITDITVSTPDYEFSETGGYYDTKYLINVTYQDEDNNPPAAIYLIFDKGGGAETPEVDLLDVGTQDDLSDMDYTDGKVYQVEYLGKNLKDNPSPHNITVWAIDKLPVGSMLKAKTSLEYYDETLMVWDDEPVEVKDPWDGIPTLQEDEPERLIPLEGFDGAFKDPENKFSGFEIWDPINETWGEEYWSELMFITVGKIDGIWQMSITLNTNQWSTEGEPIRIKAFDEHSEAQRTTRIYVNPVNDPPMVKAIMIDGMEYEVDNTDPIRPVIHLEDVEDAYLHEEAAFEFEIIAEDTDLESERVDLEFDFENGLSDPWREFPEVGYNTGIVEFIEDETITNEDVKKENSKMAFSISDRGTDGTIILTAYFTVVNKNDEPTITIPSTTPRQFTQFQSGGIRIKPIANDVDPDATLTYNVNFDTEIETDGDEVLSIEDQLPNMEARKDIDWGIDPNTGEWWFKPDDQNIWNITSGWVKSIEIVVVFEVTDDAGATATDQITLVLNDLNEEPEAPTEISANPDASTEIYIGDEISFSVDGVTDPDGDRITYKWDFGDGGTSEGREVTHIYSKKGWRTVQMWVEDGQFQTEKISYRLEILEKDDGGGETPGPGDNPGDIQSDGGTDDNTWIFIVIGAIVLVIIIFAIILFAVLRKKDAPAAQQYPMYDQAQMGAYGAQGLPPGQAEQLPPGAAPELPPGQEYPPEQLPPAAPETEVPAPQPGMEAQTEVPAAQPEMEAQPEAPAGNACPSCGSAVDPSWFLCPNCKSPLQ